MAITVIKQTLHDSIDKTSVRVVTEYNGLSSDVKPTDCGIGSIFQEVDNGDIYEFNGIGWFLSVLGANQRKRPIYDNSGRINANSVFGEQITGHRRPTTSTQFQYGANTYEINLSTANGGQVLNQNAMLTGSTGTNPAGLAQAQTKRALRYVSGHEAYCFFTGVFTQGVPNSSQRIGLFDDVNGFFIGFEGDQFGITHRKNSISNFIPQVNFNIDKINGTGYSKFNIDPTKGNVFAIKFGYLGFACIYFEVSSDKGEWILFHRIEYPNTSTTPHIYNSILPITGRVENTGNTTDIRLSSGSISAGIVNSASLDPSTRTFGSQLPTTTISTTSGTLGMFRNKATFNSITNYIPALLDLISIAVDGNKNVILQLYKNPTITNTPTWTSVDANSTLERSINATTTIGSGQLLISINLEKVGQFYEKLSEFDFLLYPNETASFVWQSAGGVTSQVDLGIRWSELF